MNADVRKRLCFHAEWLADEANRLRRVLQRSEIDEDLARLHLAHACQAADKCWNLLPYTIKIETTDQVPLVIDTTERAVAPPVEERARKKGRRRV